MFVHYPFRRTLFVLLFLVNTAVYAQLDIPVDHYSGSPIITVPLYTVNDRSLSHSIMLAYNAGGVKVDDKASSVGLNWTLVAGGEVRRELRGLPDDYVASGADMRRGWFHNNNASTIGNRTYVTDGSGLSCANESAEYNFINGLGYNVDSEPDIFHFSAGGISGSFVFDNTGDITGIKLIPYQDVTVIPYRVISTSPITAFTIVTAGGTKYYFANTEQVTRKATKSGASDPFFIQREYEQYKNSLSYIGAWKLTSITSAIGERIAFTYGAMTPIVSGNKVSVYPYDVSSYYKKDEYEIEETTHKSHLASITAQQSIVFTTSIAPYTSNHFRLNQINVNSVNDNTSIFIKAINFAYQYVTSSLPNEPVVERMFLKEIEFEDACEVSEPYQFNYDGITTTSTPEIGLPNIGSTQQDIWGFYQSHGGTTTIPNIYINPSLTGYDRINLFQKSVAGEITVAGSNMIGTSTPTAGVLSSIRYPSGAKSFFEYEPHQFHNPITGSTMTGGGLRIKKITLRDGFDRANDIVKSYEYLNGSSASSGKLFALPVFWQLTGCHRQSSGTVTQFGSLTGTTADKWKKVLLRFEKNINPDFNASSSIGYEYVTERISSGQGKIVYQFDVPNVYGTTTATDFSEGYTHIARAAVCPSPAFMVPGYFESPLALQTPFQYARGLPLKISQFIEGEATPISEVINTYQTKSVNGATIKGLQYDRTPYSSSGYFYTYSDYTLIANKTKVLISTSLRNRDRDNGSVYNETTSSFTYGSNHAMITKSVVVNSDGTELISNRKYVKDYPILTTTAGDIQVFMIDMLSDAGAVGVTIEQTEGVKRSGENEFTMSGTLSMLDDFGTTIIPVILPKEIYTLPSSGIQSFALSSFSTVSGVTSFVKNAGYKKALTSRYRAKGDLESVENRERQKTSYHTDTRSGVPVATFENTEANAIVYTNFDQNTDFDFDLLGFLSADRFATGRTGTYGLGGWRQSSSKYLRKQLQKKPDEKYVFSAWYKAPEAIASPGDHSFSIRIKNTGGTTLITRALNFPATVAGEWYYAEEIIDLSSTPSEIVVELHFNDTYTSSGSGVLDEVLFKPEGTIMARSTLQAGFGVAASVAPDGRIMKREYDASGKPRYVRDHENNIVQKTSFTRWSGTVGITQNPISMQVPATIYDNQEITIKALTGCLDVAGIQWKVVPVGSTGGSFFTGSDELLHTFTAAGTYTITLKVIHPAYGEYTLARNVTVVLAPLSVSICISAGPIEVDLCYPYNPTTTVWDMDCTSTTPDVYTSTTFNVSISGCLPGATYTYYWQKLEHPGQTWTAIGTNSPTVSVSNLGAAYDVRCFVSSSCGRTGTSGARTVYLYRSTPGCLAALDPPEGPGGLEPGDGGQ